MLFQALHVKIEMKNQNLQVTLLVQKGVGTRSHAKNRCGNAVPTRSHPTTPLLMDNLPLHHLAVHFCNGTLKTVSHHSRFSVEDFSCDVTVGGSSLCLG